ncbi:hypothetical protein C8046_08485 [Serinibacter arcticus]|uniref:Uncharacterized protein n=1 Tax=Serinibacter arcticus TaxID=1655435 RepID=A0A2U1ZUM4_9MICO|nr:hypothetical protein [Serinibacter arcticus]PWD50685.1 hypothetical protein C8046_08485 [Serinibacter arcticus]
MPVDLSSLRLRYADVARALDVRRPVVSMWRTRSADTSTPFPSGELIRADELLAWLRDTGRDRVGEAALLALHGDLEIPGLSTAEVASGAEALLVLARLTGEHLGGLGPAGLVSLADDLDPDDAFLVAEIEALGAHARQIAGFVTLMLDAVPDPGSALEVRRRRAGSSPRIHSTAVSLVTRVALALAGWGPGEDVAVVDAFPGDGDLAAGMPRVVGGWEGARLVVPSQGGGAAARAHRRRMHAHGWIVVEAGRRPGGPLVVADLTGVGDAAEALEHADEIALGMSPGARAVLIGRGSAFAGGLGVSFEDGLRADLLRTGRVRAIVGLPPGLIPGRPRESVTLWVMGDPMDATALERRWTTVTDVARLAGVGGTLPGVVLDDLVTDVLAAVEGDDAGRRHSFAHASVVRTRALVLRRGSLLTLADRDRWARSSSDLALAERAADLVRSSATPPREELPLIVSSHVPNVSELVTIEALIGLGQLRVIPGARVPESLGERTSDRSGSGLRVLTAADVIAGVVDVDRRVDAFTLAQVLPAARLTQPGDVVITATPRPAAVVDVDGGALVATPARVIRVTPGSGVSPHLAAAAVCDRPVGDRRWQRWFLPRVTPEAARTVEEAWAVVAERESQLRGELDRLAQLRRAIAEGISDGSVRIVLDQASESFEERSPRGA